MAGFTALVFAYLLSQFYRSFLAVLTPVLGPDLGMSDGQLAQASGAWFLLFAVMQIPVGYWLDTYGPRLTAGLLHGVAGGGGAALFAMSQNGTHLIIAMALIGIGCAPVLMAAVYLFARMYSPARFATLSSTFIAVGSLGNVVASEPMAAAAASMGWRQACWYLCAITVIVAVAILLAVRDPERIVIADRGKGAGSYFSLMKIRQLWPILPCVFVGYAVVAGIRGLWAGPYLEQVYGQDMLQIGRISLFLAIALSLGSLMYGPLDRIFNTRKWVVFWGNAIVAIAVLWLALLPPASVAMAAVFLVVIGLFGAGYAVQLAHVRGFVPNHMAGRGVTLMNFFAIGGAALMQLLTGWTYDYAAQSAGQDAAFRALFLFYGVVLAASLAIYLFSRDVKPHPH
jgi:MFS family permease